MSSDIAKMSAEEVLIIRKKLEKIIRTKTRNHASVMELLEALQKSSITLEQLKETKIGLTVNSLRKESSNEEVTMRCKNMIKAWKKLLSDSSGIGKVNDKAAKESSSKIEPPETAMDSHRDDIRNDESKMEATEINAYPSTDGHIAENTKVSKRKKQKRKRKHRNRRAAKRKRKEEERLREQERVRLKCRGMLADALRADDADDQNLSKSAVLAESIEEHIFKEIQDTGSKYRNRVRSRVANLKDVKHPDLRDNVLKGVIQPERFAKMTAEEMASDEMKDLRAKFTQEAIHDHQLGMIDGTASDLYSCEKCGSNKCTYKQVQLLCSDEPMTTFLLCYNCGYRWSFT